MSTPAKHDIEKPVLIWHITDVAKVLVGLLFALVALIVTAIPQPVTISGVLQVVVVALGAVAVYPMPAGWTFWGSWKVRITAIAAVLSALVPLAVTYLDTGAWHNLTAVQWLVVAVAVGKVFGVYLTPNSEPFNATGAPTQQEYLASLPAAD